LGIKEVKVKKKKEKKKKKRLGTLGVVFISDGDSQQLVTQIAFDSYRERIYM
jgi:hypothetical protein